MAESPTGVLVAGYSDIDGATKDFDSQDIHHNSDS